MADLFRHEHLTRPVLLDLFNPPEGYEGNCCLITGFCADTAFLEEAMLQFTGQVAASRARHAILHGLVFLDPRQEPTYSMQVPGLIRVSRKESAWNGKTGLLHAKLLWLVFRHPQTRQQLLRVVVSTGNWTRSGSEKLIDLVWITEVDPVPGQWNTEKKQEAADCRAASTFLRNVASLFCIDGVPEYREIFERALSLLTIPDDMRLPKTNLIDSWTSSLADRIKEKLGSQRPNFALAGSGFFEHPVIASDGSVAKPAILSWLESVTGPRSPWQHLLVVNPQAAGAVAVWRAKGGDQTRRWIFHAAGTSVPQDSRSLHAKFIFFSNVSERQPLMKGAVYEKNFLYLGSGNLSKQGFLSAWDNGAGNIELGVLVNLPADLHSAELTRILPVGTPIEASTQLQMDSDEVDAVGMPPVSAIAALRGDAGGFWHILWTEEPRPTRLLIANKEFIADVDQASVYDESLPPMPTAAAWVGTPEEGQWIGIPVIDQNGAVCRQPFSAMGFDDLMLQLTYWRTSATDGDDDGDGDDDDSDTGRSGGIAPDNIGDRDRFPISRASLLIEQIAQIHDKLEMHELPAWLRRLEALLVEATDPSLIDAWRALGIDFLDCLIEAPFLPACLSEGPDEERQKWTRTYQDVVGIVRNKWNLAGGESRQ